MARKTLIASMKNEGPFILEWIAYHRAIGFDSIIIGSNDCADRSDALLDALALEGFISHRRNVVAPDQDPQHLFLQRVRDHWLLEESDWLLVLDADEFLNIQIGEGRVDDLLSVVPQDADALVLLWKNFGDAGLSQWAGGLVTEQFTRCEPKIERHNRFHKTLFKNNGKFNRMNAHYPSVDPPVDLDGVRIYNAEFEPYALQNSEEGTYFRALQQDEAKWTWRNAYVNHYPFKTEDLFFVKRHRGDNVPGRADWKYATGSWYYALRNNNQALDSSMLRLLPDVKRELALLRKSAVIREAEAEMLAGFDALRRAVVEKYAAEATP